MRNFNLLFCFALALALTSCSEQESPVCEHNLSFPQLPESTFLDGYYTDLTEEFNVQQLSSCECEDLLLVQEFRNENIGNYLPFPMEPITLPCTELQDLWCVEEEEDQEQIIIDQFMEPFSEAIEQNLILENEYSLMTSFFNDLVLVGIVDFDDYWCQLELMEKPEDLSNDVAGLLSAYTITYFQGPSEYFTANYADFQSEDIAETRWLPWLYREAMKLGIRATVKYGASMYVLIDGALDGKDTSYEALCTALD